MQIIAIIAVMLTGLTYGVSAQDAAPLSPFASITNTLAQIANTQWVERNGALNGSTHYANGSWEYSCIILQNLPTHPEATQSWEYRLFYCSAPTYILAVSDDYALLSTYTNLTGSLTLISDALGTKPIYPIRYLRDYILNDCGMVEEFNPEKLRKK